ncbi:heavy metal translocating P-type ATPase [Planctomyces sp. SH-PL62]|uniref:heavy metal translocating P-type ATPase n=1 Tax=Planctomyces sp. SH-PL62 TaxID=1636152 RepID=UPI00078CD20E|nr:cation-translocating P-type ATPase [Planctomyces sp. SH-PL62]AMV40572.1 putative cadmium-transporting ATPase [Planctomyces sp. SH-PL62]
MSRSRCTFQVRGLDCEHEVGQLRAVLKGAPGVENLGFDLINGLMTVEYDASRVDPRRLAAQVTDRSGLATTLVGEPEAEAPPSWWSRRGMTASTAASGVALSAGMLLHYFGTALGLSAATAERASTACCALAIAAGGLWLFPRAVKSMARLRLDIDALMTLAIAGAVALGQWDEAATVAFLFGVSESLEALSVARARRAIRRLLEVAPPTAERIVGEDVETIAVDRIEKGDRLLVRSGDQIPIDGSVLKGRSTVDQKAITGESTPVERGPGDPVYAGTINGEGTIEVEASGTIEEALVSRIVDQVRAAQAGRAPVERRISQFARWYTPLVVVVALLTAVVPPAFAWGTGGAAWPTFLEWSAKALVVLVISCPCALVIATPVAVVSGLAAAARRGVLIKGGEFLEAVGKLRAIAFDKTGTLTLGRPDVVEVVASGLGDESHVLRIAAALGDRGGHVLGKAIARHARELRLDVPPADDYTAIPGKGALGRIDAEEYHLGSHRYIDEVGLCQPEFHDEMGRAEGRVGTEVAVTTATAPLGWIRLADRPRPEAAAVVAELHALGLRTVMLTGDNPRAAAAMARELGVGEQRAELLPADKVRAIDEYTAAHGPTGMVGDGVNDAPALAAARVSIALGGVSSGAALETADVVLMADDLRQLPWLVRHGRATLRMIHQNIALAIGVKAVVLVLALFGIANMWMAILADVGTTLLVVANALRLLRAGTPTDA